MVFIKHNYQVRHFLIPYLFHVFQDLCISGSKFFTIQVFQGQGPGFRSSPSREYWNPECLLFGGQNIANLKYKLCIQQRVLAKPSLVTEPVNLYLFKVNNRNIRKKCTKYVQSKVLRHQNDVIEIDLVSSLSTLNLL